VFPLRWSGSKYSTRSSQAQTPGGKTSRGGFRIKLVAGGRPCLLEQRLALPSMGATTNTFSSSFQKNTFSV